MALVKYDAKKTATAAATGGGTSWTKRDKHATQHALPADIPRPKIDYQKLREMLAVNEMFGRNQEKSSNGASHDYFMKNYKTMFVSDEPKKGVPYHSLDRSLKKSSGSISALSTTADSVQAVDDGPTEARSSARGKAGRAPGGQEESHDIRDHLAKLHKMRKAENQKAKFGDDIKLLRRLLKKLPFERTASENEEIVCAVERLPAVSAAMGGSVDRRVLKELCVVTQLEAWREEGITVFGNMGLHVVLKGSVKALTEPWLKTLGEDVTFRSPTPTPDFDTMPRLGVGSCFGTLERVEGREPNSRVLTVLTMEEGCEFLKISTHDYSRVRQQIKQRDETEKVNLLQSCETFKYWSKQPLSRVANILEWTTFPPNTVIVSEGYMAPFAAIIKSGDCHVLRQVDVIKTQKNGEKETRLKQVVMGSLGPSASFGEISIIKAEPITCSIITATPVSMAIIEPHKLSELDETTIQLLEHSSVKTYGNLTKRDIFEEYVAQEAKREWNEFKHNVVVDTLNAVGIRPGYGRWTKH